jgi:hypothetical protein
MIAVHILIADWAKAMDFRRLSAAARAVSPHASVTGRKCARRAFVELTGGDEPMAALALSSGFAIRRISREDHRAGLATRRLYGGESNPFKTSKGHAT